jgi:hypothetical protein
VGHMAQALKFAQGRVAASGDIRVASLRQSPGRADEMGQARLPLGDPVLLDTVAIADQDALPLVD